jgi:serine/threonine-protein kinase
MFMNEARLAARLNHPNIVQTNEVFEHQGLPILVMEHLQGQALSEVLSRARGRQKFPLTMHLRVISDVLSGLHYSHELRDFDGTPLNVVHRDMSPHNVFVTFDGQVKLLDFGIAKLAGSHVETETGVIKGKIRYMSPEQITGENVDSRADLFAVGVMLWEAAAEARMWAGKSEATIMNHLLNGEVPSPKSVNPGVSDALERIVMKALASRAADRYASAAELQSELDDYVTSLGTQVRPRDIGKAVSDLFQEERAQTRRIIEAQLSKVASLSDAEYATVQPIELTSLTATQSTSTHFDAPGSAQRNRRRFLGYLGATLLVGLASVGAWGMVGKGKSRSADASGTSIAVAPVAPPSTIQLRVTAFPATAKIYLDGNLLPSNPYAQALPRDGTKHALRFEAEDHDVDQRELAFDQDAELVVTLRRTPKRPEPEIAPTVSKPKVAVARKRRKAAAASACEPPFVVDERGVKRYKPECL